MHTTESAITRTRTLTVSLTETEHAEFTRLSRERHDRTPGKQGQRVVREWIAAEQAAEAEAAAQGKAA
ncbi:MAG: hypothetical protein KGZ65_06215 [Sphingomonadales bacterium]|nr:hypothetical protein [Sphingomonadaceae bacterium]MBS3930814.1 hypothetical protein [Sphingomonadales bacterium]